VISGDEVQKLRGPTRAERVVYLGQRYRAAIEYDGRRLHAFEPHRCQPQPLLLSSRDLDIQPPPTSCILGVFDADPTGLPPTSGALAKAGARDYDVNLQRAVADISTGTPGDA
jgi:hypothetical protein